MKINLDHISYNSLVLLNNHATQSTLYFFRRFKNFDSVIGYELMNEPFAGNVFEEGHLKILPGIAGEENLVPFYDIIQSEIRKIDDETIILWEPVSIKLAIFDTH